MNKNNFFNFKNKNIWDIGFPCSPRKFFMGLFIVILIIVLLAIYFY